MPVSLEDEICERAASVDTDTKLRALCFVLCTLTFAFDYHTLTNRQNTKNKVQSTSVLHRNPAPTFIRSTYCIQHELHSIAVLKSRGVFHGCFACPHRFTNGD